MTIRPANPSDLKAIQDLNHELFKHDAEWISHLVMDWPYDPETGEAYFKGLIDSSDKFCFVAESDGEIIGYLAGTISKPESYRTLKRAELENMFVKPDHRGQGIGSKLVAEFKHWCQKRGVQKILVIASEPNASAIEFYKSAGFAPYSLELEMDLEK